MTTQQLNLTDIQFTGNDQTDAKLRRLVQDLVVAEKAINTLLNSVATLTSEVDSTSSTVFANPALQAAFKVSGLAAGEVLQALTATSATFAKLNLSQLGDVAVSQPTPGQVLTYEYNEWVNVTPTETSGGATGRNIGNGSGPYAGLISGVLAFKSISGDGATIEVTASNDTITLSYIGSSSTIVSASGVGPPGLDGDVGDDPYIVPGPPGPAGAAGATGPSGQTVVYAQPEDYDEPYVIPGPPGAAGAAGATGVSGKTVVYTLPDEFDDPIIIPGPPGAAGAQGATGVSGKTVVYALPEEFDDAIIIPGPPGAAGAAGASGLQGPPVYLPADDPDDPIVVPGPQGPAANGSGGGSVTFLNANITPDSHPQNPTPRDDEFESGTSINTSQWTQANFSGGGTSVGRGILSMTSGRSGTDNPSFVYQSIAVPSAAWEFDCKLLEGERVSSSSSDVRGGMFVGVGSTGEGYLFGRYTDGSNVHIYVNRQPSYGGSPTNLFNLSNDGGGLLASFIFIPIYLKITYDGSSTISFYWSWDGFVYKLGGTETLSAFLTTAPMSVGLYTDGPGTTVSFDWFRDYTNGYSPSTGELSALAPFNVTPDTHPAIPTGAGLGPNDEFEYGSALDTAGARYTGATPWALPASNSLGFVGSIVAGQLFMNSTTGGGSVNNNTVISQPLPSGSFTYECKVLGGNNSSYSGIWLGVTSTGEGLYIGYYEGQIYALYQTDYEGAGIVNYGNQGVLNQGVLGGTTFPTWLRISWDGTTYTLSATQVYGVWPVIASVTGAGRFSGTPNGIGLYSSMEVTTSPNAIFDWFRRAA